jgi:hypothetical protein
MRVVHQAPGLRIEGDTDAVVVPGHGTRDVVVVAGDVVGRRVAAGALERLGGGPLDMAPLVGRWPIERWREALEGRFALIAVREDGTCEIAADRFGRRDLYYQRHAGGAVFATDLELLPVSRGPEGYDQAALAHVVTAYGWRPPKRHTLYRGVHRLGVGETARAKGAELRIDTAAFTPLAATPWQERDFHEYADIFLDTLEASGSRNGNVVYLSSGWDSTSILAGLVKVFGTRRVRAVIGRMQYSERAGVINQFELDRARAMAEYFGVRLDTVEFDYRKQIPPVFERLQPLLRRHQLAGMTLYSHGTLADFVARTTTGDETVFAGEISDGVHNLGYSQFATIFHPVLDFREYSDKMGSYLFGPTFLAMLEKGTHATDLIYTLFRGRAGAAQFDDPAADLAGRRRQLLASFFLRGARLPLISLKNSRALTPRGRELYAAEIEMSYLDEAGRTLTPQTLYAWYLQLYNSFHWQGSTVATMAATADAHGLRLALPFWDSRLHEALATMPESCGRGLDLNPTKYPLKWMLRHRVDYPMHLQVGPHSYLYDVDPTFSHGVETVYHSAFTPFFKEGLRARPYHALFAREFFDVAYLDGLADRYLAGEELTGSDMGDLVTLLWLVTAGWYGGR